MSAEGKAKITDHEFEPMLGGVCRAFVGYDTETGYAYCFEPESAHADTQEKSK